MGWNVGLMNYRELCGTEQGDMIGKCNNSAFPY